MSEFPFSEGELIKLSQERTLDGKPTPEAKSAFGILYLAYQRRIVTFLAHSLGNRERAEDLTQDTFVNAWRKIGDFKDQPAKNGSSAHSAFARWLYTIAKRELLQYWRKHKGLPQQEVSLDKDDHEQVASIDPQSQDIEEQVILQDEISAILQQLTPKRRLLLILYHKDGFSYAEIAEIMDMSITAVSAGLCRANQQFQELYSKRQAIIAEQVKKGGRSQ